ncbi:MAG: hypothetical protein HY246_18960 [Proteobacteria bacterium]|nr:hypothetical protein [Pseudomonadota bacterium]
MIAVETKCFASGRIPCHLDLDAGAAAGAADARSRRGDAQRQQGHLECRIGPQRHLDPALL